MRVSRDFLLLQFALETVEFSPQLIKMTCVYMNVEKLKHKGCFCPCCITFKFIYQSKCITCLFFLDVSHTMVFPACLCFCFVCFSLVEGPTPKQCWWQQMERSWQRQRDRPPITGWAVEEVVWVGQVEKCRTQTEEGREGGKNYEWGGVWGFIHALYIYTKH